MENSAGVLTILAILLVAAMVGLILGVWVYRSKCKCTCNTQHTDGSLPFSYVYKSRGGACLDAQDIESEPRSTTLEGCMDACTQNANCGGFSYNATGSDCNLKDTQSYLCSRFDQGATNVYYDKIKTAQFINVGSQSLDDEGTDPSPSLTSTVTVSMPSPTPTSAPSPPTAAPTPPTPTMSGSYY